MTTKKSMLEEVKLFVGKHFDKTLHFERTVYWLKQLKPNVDEAMEIAAYAHDIERAFGRATIEFWKTHALNDSDYLKNHQEKGAEIITKFLQEKGYPKKDTKRIAEMVRLHEVGGTEEADLIKDADSISYFEVNAPKHIEKFGKPLGKAKLMTKYDFMFNRITSKKAKEICQEWYNQFVKEAEEKL